MAKRAEKARKHDLSVAKMIACFQTKHSDPYTTATSAFLDALASLDFKLSVSQWVSDVFQLAHLRVFQSYLDCSSTWEI